PPSEAGRIEATRCSHYLAPFALFESPPPARPHRGALERAVCRDGGASKARHLCYVQHGSPAKAQGLSARDGGMGCVLVATEAG
ncbi:MAG: hypothetical protein ACPIOQ_49870, partial [Promethearchaeia archaeon]